MTARTPQPEPREWCGADDCDPQTRIRGWLGDNPRRCPDCHPLAPPPAEPVLPDDPYWIK